MQSLVILALAVSDNIQHLPELVLGLNTGLMALVLLRSWL
jgi:hypothetical protein